MTKTKAAFEVWESGDEAEPYMVWDAQDGTPYSYHGTALDAAARLVRLGWSLRRAEYHLDPMWPE